LEQDHHLNKQNEQGLGLLQRKRLRLYAAATAAAVV
jgi:hypothetical protein